MKESLSAIANGLLLRCAEILDTSKEDLIEEFEMSLDFSTYNYSRGLVEYFSSRAVERMCGDIGEKFDDGNFSRFTFYMMLAWEIPSTAYEQFYLESFGKEEDRKEVLQGNEGQLHDDFPLFYLDVMSLLVDGEKHVGADAFVWLGSILPLAADPVNALFIFNTLTTSTAGRLHYPAYDIFLKGIIKYIKHLQKQSVPEGFKISEDEFILHVEGAGMSQWVVHHIGSKSWPGRLILTNLALYFEASKLTSYDNSLKIDLSSTSVDHEVMSASTGTFGTTLFDKAIAYKSSQLTRPVILEFPEMASSNRRDYWLALIKEVILMHRFISKAKDEPFEEKTYLQASEAQARTILGVMRLHAAKDMLITAPPLPMHFLIFTFDEPNKGAYVMQEIRKHSQKAGVLSACNASSVLKNLNMQHPIMITNARRGGEITPQSLVEKSLASLDTSIEQVRGEAKKTSIAKTTVERIGDEGITDSMLALAELLNPLKNLSPRFQMIISWKTPELSFSAFVITLIIIYMEWFGPAIGMLLFLVVAKMIWARQKRIREVPESVLSPPSDKTTVEGIEAAQNSLKNIDAIVKTINTTILKIKSIVLSNAPEHANMAMLGLSGAALLLMVVPFRLMLIGLVTYIFMSNLNPSCKEWNEQRNRRLKEWWETIPITPAPILSRSP